MAKQRNNRRQKQGIQILKQKGLQAIVLGAAMLLVSPLFASSPVLNTLASALRTFAWPLLVIGMLLLGAYAFFKRVADKTGGPTDGAAHTPSPAKSRGRLKLIEPTLAPTTEPTPPTSSPTPASAWSPAVFAAIEWRRFEAVCEALFAQAGYTTRAQSHGADGGVDIWLHTAGTDKPVAVVQCKHWQGKPVGVKEIREFFGVMASHKLQRGIYATTSTYTEDAQQFATANGIAAMDGPALLAMIAKRTPEQQQAVLAVAHEGEYWKPTCASCGVKMLERTPSKGGTAFWGCSNYPKCKTRLAMPAVR
jgi:restriction system protein